MDPVRHRRLTLLLASPRVAPGLLSADAWDALRSADHVVAADPTAPHPAGVAAAGVDVRPVRPDGSGAPPSPGDLADLLLSLVARHGTVVWLGSADGDPGLSEALAVALPEEDPPVLELLVASWDVPGARLLDAVAVMDRLRGPGGCPWDARQTHASLTPYLVEEAFEAVEALERLDDDGADRDHAREELGDVLLQVLFHARVAAEHGQEPFDVDDVAAGLVDKLVHRHPHVFAPGGGEDLDAAQVESRWEQLKAQENRTKPGRQGVLDGIPAGMPELARATKVTSRLRRAGHASWLRGWTAARLEGRDPGALLLEEVLDLHDVDVDAAAALRRTLADLLAEAPAAPDRG
ncbi:MazG family protein [uncultured Ornithinimicrobium sp.]|uniref:MazG family protein n=1 Tax=uncultured Ornithinimicrobium sp. TaxID=259307 RepID=UPI00259A4559|nr:MazG family protein [uncultured Ornithinimicrobium sp.]